MVGLIPPFLRTILEPTPGQGNIVKELKKPIRNYKITAPKNYFDLDKNLRFDCIVMNPPFSVKYCFGQPAGYEKHGMRLGYHMILECMTMSDNLVILTPWFTIVDSDVRMRHFKAFGLRSITALPRKTFQYSRIQTMVMCLEKGFKGDTIFNTFNF